MTALAIVVLSFAASLTVWYHLASLSARNGDNDWFAISVGFLVLLGGIFLAIGVST